MLDVCAPPRPAQTVVDESEPTYLALNNDLRWDRLRVLVTFLDGDPALHERVRRVVAGREGWNSASALQFEFAGGGGWGDVRVTFTRGGSWSYVGMACLHQPKPEPTMQLGWLDLDTNDTEFRRVVLHEFGHACGYEHEHRSPSAHIPWDVEKVYEYYWRTQGWSREKVNDQVLTPIAASVLTYSAWDTDSIMHYRIDPSLTTNGIALGGQTVLSPVDRLMAGLWYGPPPMHWWATFLPVVSGGAQA